jgi:hypothetical protein
MLMRRTFLSLLSLLSTRSPTAWNYGPIGHLKVSKTVWQQVVSPGSIVIDATCGNGHDSSFLGKLCLAELGKGSLYCIDIQQQAIESTKKKLSSEFTTEMMERVKFVCASHESFPSEITPSSVSLIVYNLGYLPGMTEDKSSRLITKTASTLDSLNNAIPLIAENGLLSVTAYPGHEGGQEECTQVRKYLSTLDTNNWRVYEHVPVNRMMSPQLFLAYKIDKRPKDPDSVTIRFKSTKFPHNPSTHT